MKTAVERLNNIEGQIEGVKKMMTNKDDCLKVLTQLKAIKSAIAGVMDMMVDGQFESCLKSMGKNDKQLFIKLKNYVKSN